MEYWTADTGIGTKDISVPKLPWLENWVLNAADSNERRHFVPTVRTEKTPANIDSRIPDDGYESHPFRNLAWKSFHSPIEKTFQSAEACLKKNSMRRESSSFLERKNENVNSLYVPSYEHKWKTSHADLDSGFSLSHFSFRNWTEISLEIFWNETEISMYPEARIRDLPIGCANDVTSFWANDHLCYWIGLPFVCSFQCDSRQVQVSFLMRLIRAVLHFVGPFLSPARSDDHCIQLWNPWSL